MYIDKNHVINIESTSNNMALNLNFVKSYLRVDFEEDDELIAKLIKTATSQCEKYINKSLIEKTYIYSFYKAMNNILYLPFGPIKNIIEIKILINDKDGYILNDEQYTLDTVGEFVYFKNKIDNFYRVDIKYKAGFSVVNEDLVQGLLIHIARMYEDRSGFSLIPNTSLSIYKKYKQIKL